MMRPLPSVGAYVPCFNSVLTVRAAVESILAQTASPKEVIVIDDGSSDGSADTVRDLGVRIITHQRNSGRGAVRDTAMRELQHEFVLCCDATNVLDPQFTKNGLSWFAHPRVAAVFGQIKQPPARNVVERWRGRHLFKLGLARTVAHDQLLSTGGAIVRSSAVRQVGGFDPHLWHTEDADLGMRLSASGFDVIQDPRLQILSVSSNTIAQVMERYWRWYAGTPETASWGVYWKNIGYSIKAMAAADLVDRDPLSVPISLLTPHYQFWRSWLLGRRPRQPVKLISRSL